MSTASKVKLFFGIMWIISGATKFLQLAAEQFSGKEMASASFLTFAKLCILPFYADIITVYFRPMAALFIFLAGLIEVIAGLLILRSGTLIRVGLALGIAMNIAYAPLAGIYTIIPNIFLIIAQVWLWKKI